MVTIVDAWGYRREVSVGKLRRQFEYVKGDGGWTFRDYMGFEDDVKREVKLLVEVGGLDAEERRSLGELLGKIADWYGGVNFGAVKFRGMLRERQREMAGDV